MQDLSNLDTVKMHGILSQKEKQPCQCKHTCHFRWFPFVMILLVVLLYIMIITTVLLYRMLT